MSEQNVVEVIVVPEVPKVIPDEEIYVYVPVATNTNKGIASFDDEFFNVAGGAVSLSNDFVSSKQDKLTSDDVLGTINGQVFKFGQDITIETLDYVTSTELNERVSLEISKLINSAPETLDTLGEIAIALENNEEVIEVLNNAISNKVNKNEFDVVDDKVTTLVNDVTKNSNSILALEESVDEIIDEITEIQDTLIGVGIIDVEALPTDNISEKAFYRMGSGTYTLLQGQKSMLLGYPLVVSTVDALPAVGEPIKVSPTDPSRLWLYLQTSDMKLYAYFPQSMERVLGVSGWQLYDILYELDEDTPQYQIVSSVDEIENLDEYKLYVIYNATLPPMKVFQYKDGWFEVGADSNGITEDKVKELIYEAISGALEGEY